MVEYGIMFLTYGFMDPKCNDFVSFFFICRSMDSSDEFEQELYDGVDLWDDDDIEKSLSMFFMFFIFINISSSNRDCGT